MLGIPHRYLTPDLSGIGGVIKRDLEDFIVEEVPLYEPSGSGEHTYFGLEKRDLSTLEALERLGRHLGCEPREIGFAGMKDRKGVTRQTFSVRLIPPERVLGIDAPQMKVLWVKPHRNKLRVGHLKGNRFEIRIRDVGSGAAARVAPIVAAVEAQGLPNYFGPQRFGNRGDAQWVGRSLLKKDDRAAVRRVLGRAASSENNPHVVAARFLFEQYRWSEALEVFPASYREERKLLRYLLQAGENYSGARRRMRPDVVKLYYTAYQAYLFNLALERRLDRSGGDLRQIWSGDVAHLHRNGALFPVESVEGLAARVSSFEISATGPIFGKKMLRPGGVQAAIEEEVLALDAIRHEDFHRLDSKLHLHGGRRPIRIPVAELQWAVEGTDLCLKFFLPKGSYATTFLRELMKNEQVAPGFLES